MVYIGAFIIIGHIIGWVWLFKYMKKQEKKTFEFMVLLDSITDKIKEKND